MSRSIHLYFCDFNGYLDFSFLDLSKVSVRQTLKGDSTPSGKGQLPYNVISIEYTASDLPDEYDARINILLDTIGERVIRELIETYQARINDICLGIPCKTSENVEEGFISKETLRKLCDLGLGVQFYYI